MELGSDDGSRGRPGVKKREAPFGLGPAFQFDEGVNQLAGSIELSGDGASHVGLHYPCVLLSVIELSDASEDGLQVIDDCQFP